MATVFLRLLAHDDKAAALSEAVERLRDGQDSPDVHVVDPESFRQVPGSPFAYWVSERVRNIFTKLPQFEAFGREVKVGGQTSDDFRYLRLFWEIPTSDVSLDWRPYQKGGDYSPYYLDLPLVADWDDGRQTYRNFYGRLGRPNHHPSSYQWFFRPGLAYTPRTLRGLSFRIHPKRCVFAHKGPVVFASGQDLLPLLGLLNSRAFEELALLQMAAASYEVGVIQRTPVHERLGEHGVTLGELSRSAVDLKRSLDITNETRHLFVIPAVLHSLAETLIDRIMAWRTRVADTDRHLVDHQRKIDDIAFRLYGIDSEDRRAMEEESGLKANAKDVEAQEDEPGDDTDPVVEGKPLTADLLS